NGNPSDQPRHPLEQELEARAHTLRERKSGGGTLDGAAQRLIDAWRLRGHLTADTDPLGLKERLRVDELEPTSHGLSDADYKQAVETDWAGHLGSQPLGELIDSAHQVYGGHMAVEFSHVSDPAEWCWLAEHIEGNNGWTSFSESERRRLLAGLTSAEGLEKYLHRRY